MSEKDDILKNIGSAEYKHGFETLLTRTSSG